MMGLICDVIFLTNCFTFSQNLDYLDLLHNNLAPEDFCLRAKSNYIFLRSWNWSISPYSVSMRENTDQKNSEYEQFSRSAPFSLRPLVPLLTLFYKHRKLLNWILLIEKDLEAFFGAVVL